MLIKTPYLVQEDKVAVIESDKFCKILLISKSDWQSLEPVDCDWGSVGGWNGELSVLVKDI